MSTNFFQSSIEIKKKNPSCRETLIKSADNIIENIYKKPYKKETVMNSNNLAPIRMITVGKSSNVNAVLETKYKCLSAQFCGQYNVPGPHVTSRPLNNVLVPRYGMFNAEECYVYEHDAAVQNSKKPVVATPRDSSSFNVELDFMLDKFDSDTEETSSHTDIQGIASKYCSGPGQISGMVDWEEMVSNIADGALDMSGSRRKRRQKKSTKLRSPIMFTEKGRETTTSSCLVKPSDLDNAAGTSGRSDDVMWYDVNSLRGRTE